MKKELKNAIKEKYHLPENDTSNTNELTLEFITSALIACIIHWVKNDMTTPMEEVTSLIQDLSRNGVIDYFSNQH